jgi:hypothetical protein
VAHYEGWWAQPHPERPLERREGETEGLVRRREQQDNRFHRITAPNCPCLAEWFSNILCRFLNAAVGAKLGDLRGGAASANARADQDEVKGFFQRFSTPRSLRVVPELWGLPLGVQHSEYNSILLGHLQEVSNRCKC